MTLDKMIEQKVWAVIGANTSREKYGNIIYRFLKKKGYEVYPVNSMYDEVEGDKCYKSLSDLPKVPDVISNVVSPKIGKEYIKEASRLNIKNIIFQPGTYDDEIEELVKKEGLTMEKACILVVLGYRGELD